MNIVQLFYLVNESIYMYGSIIIILSSTQRAFRRETELENWIQKYDREMGEKQDELEQLESEFTEETTELKELEEKLGVRK
jgi:Skp family chaperone for outer membrane proteins